MHTPVARRVYIPEHGGLLVLALLTVAHAAPPGFEPVREAEGCRISMRPEDHPDGAGMRADCEWADVDALHLANLLGEYERYSEYVFPIAVARVERHEGERTLIYQRQELFGIADREVLLWMEQRRVDEGVRFSWTTASELPLALQSGSIRTPRNEGFWEVVARPEGGARVVHEIALDAGGSIPRWIVNLVRTRSFVRIMADVRAIAAKGERHARSAGPP